MKFTRHYIFIFLTLLSVLFTLAFSSCTDREESTYVIGVSQPCDDAWRQRMNEEMRRELLFHPNISVEFRNSEYDNEKQCADIEYFLKKGVDLLVVCPNESEALTPVVSKAYKNGVPVIIADREVVGNDYTAAISGNNNQVGELVGNYVVEALPEGGKVVEFLGLPDASPTITRHEPFVRIINEAENIELVASLHANWQWNEAEQIMDSLLSAGVMMDMVVAQNDQMAQGARAAADRFFSKEGHNIRFIGVDALPGEMV